MILKFYKSILLSTMLLRAGFCVQAMEQDTIHKAAERGDVAAVRLFLEQDPTLLNETDAGWAPLHCAVYCGQNGIVRLLCNQQGIIINQQDKLGRTPLLWAALFNRKSIIRLLLLHGATPIDDQYVQPLMPEVRRINAAWHHAQLSMVMGLHHRAGMTSPLQCLSIDMIRQVLRYIQSEDFQEIVLDQ